jgi:hypothetical protein
MGRFIKRLLLSQKPKTPELRRISSKVTENENQNERTQDSKNDDSEAGMGILDDPTLPTVPDLPTDEGNLLKPTEDANYNEPKESELDKQNADEYTFGVDLIMKNA